MPPEPAKTAQREYKKYERENGYPELARRHYDGMENTFKYDTYYKIYVRHKQ